MAIFSIYSIANVLSFYLAACIVAINSEESEIGKLPYCGPEKTFTQKLVLVSTLDGRLTALDAAAGGALSWSIETGPGPMLSSSIHRLELTNNGQWVRMIPSLSGGIYKFNGSSIEPIPVSADILLRSAPFTFSSDLAMSGGKETRTYGVIAGTGQVVYKCSMDGCTNSTENYAAEDVIVVQRQTQTVRAIEARSGIERWNFSVGQHNLDFLSDSYSDCHGDKTPTSLPDDFELKVIVPEGLICSVSRTNGEIIWKHKFEAPVVAAWQLHQGEMFPIDLFSGAQWSPSYNDELGPMTPTLYIGMHNRQLYIQESVTLHERVDKMSTALMTASFPSVPQIPWAPVPATALAFVGTGEKTSESTELGSTEVTTIASSFLYASEYVNGNGYYLFSSPNLKCQVDDKGNDTIRHDQDDDQSTEHEHGSSSTSYLLDLNLFHFTNWWVEILIIITSTVVLVNLLKSERFMIFMNRFPFAHRFMRYMNLLPYTNQEVLQQHVLGAENTALRLREHQHILPHRSNSEPNPQVSNEFSSRYLNDFDPVHCLGKGGFGVVFEAKNKIDDCHYAVKRIPLPNRQESRDRVMREVKALAKLDHQNIVRYFNAWLECPPPGWQEKQDKLVPNCDAFSSVIEPTSIDYSSHAGNVTLSKSSSPQKCNSVYLNLGSESESESLSKSHQLLRYNTDKSDSFIVFENSGGNESELHVDDCGEDDDDDDDDDDGNDDHDDENLDDDSGADMTEHNTESKSCIKKAMEKCMVSWEAKVTRKRTSSTTECHSEKKKLGHRRPKSLDITSGGGIILPKVSRVYLFIQMQLCRRESLREWLRDNVANRDTNEVLRIFEQIVQAVEYVHLQGLIHRDLKPSNIFFSPNGEIKVGDFGLVTAMVENSAGQRTPTPNPNYVLNADETHTARVGTQLYMSPEQALGLPYNYKVDIYSLGVILFELLVPFKTAMERSCVLMDLRNNKFPQCFQENFKQEYELLQLMLSHSPEKRPTTYGIRARPPLNQYANLPNTEDQWHFELPPLKRELSKTSSVSTNSNTESWEAV